MQRTQTAEYTDALAQHLITVGIRSNQAQQLAEALVERAHDTIEAFDSLTPSELLDLGFVDGHIKRIEAYRTRAGLSALESSQGDVMRVRMPRAAVVPNPMPVGHASNPSTPPRSPLASPPRLRIDSRALQSRIPSPAAIDLHVGGYEVYSVPASGYKILDLEEYHRAILVSHNRRDPAALNATYAMLWALRLGLDPETGAPFSRHCHKDSRRVELWSDKEQLAERGGEDWNKPILRAMTKGVTTVVFLGNAFCGSGECAKEAIFAVRERFTPIPVWLEWFASTEERFEQWLGSKSEFPDGPRAILDRDVNTFDRWQDQASQVKYYMSSAQAVPADRFDLTEFVCDICRATRDSACVECSDWSKAVARSAATAKLIDAARALGRFIDHKVDSIMFKQTGPKAPGPFGAELVRQVSAQLEVRQLHVVGIGHARSTAIG